MAKSPKSAPPGAVPVEVKPAAGASKTGATVTVACKMPNGIVIEGYRKAKRTVPVLGGGQRDELFYEPDGRRVTIYGNARAVGAEHKTRVVAQFALTQGVPKDLWDDWRENNKDMPAVKNGLIFAYPTTALTADAASDKDNRALRSGLEPLRPDGDPRTARPQSRNVSEVRTRDDVTHDFEKTDEEA